MKAERRDRRKSDGKAERSGKKGRGKGDKFGKKGSGKGNELSKKGHGKDHSRGMCVDPALNASRSFKTRS